MIVEYCSLGSLDQYLKKHKKNFVDQFASVSGLPIDDGLSSLNRTTGSTGSSPG